MQNTKLCSRRVNLKKYPRLFSIHAARFIKLTKGGEQSRPDPSPCFRSGSSVRGILGNKQAQADKNSTRERPNLEF